MSYILALNNPEWVVVLLNQQTKRKKKMCVVF